MTERTPPLLPIPQPAPAEPSVEGEAPPAAQTAGGCASAPAKPRLEPTRYGDWEMNGKCVDF